MRRFSFLSKGLHVTVTETSLALLMTGPPRDEGKSLASLMAALIRASIKMTGGKVVVDAVLVTDGEIEFELGRMDDTGDEDELPDKKDGIFNLYTSDSGPD